MPTSTTSTVNISTPFSPSTTTLREKGTAAVAVSAAGSPTSVITYNHNNYNYNEVKTPTTTSSTSTARGSYKAMDDVTHQLAGLFHPTTALSSTNDHDDEDDENTTKKDKEHNELAEDTTTMRSSTETTSTTITSVSTIRDQIFHLLICMGQLAARFIAGTATTSITTTTGTSNKMIMATDQVVIATILREMITIVFRLSEGLSIHLFTASCNKIQLNAKKYPVALCKGKSGKYTEYSQQTGITKTVGQSTIVDVASSIVDEKVKDMQNTMNYNTLSYFIQHSVPYIQEQTRIFAIDRDWLQYHTPRNIALALSGEIGELAEIFQFMGDDDTNTTTILSDRIKLDKIGQELADVTIYLCRLSDVCQIPITIDSTTVEAQQEE